jgi:hypothetical protein
MVFKNPTRRLIMAKKLDPAELVSFKELLMANSIMADALVQLLIDKGLYYPILDFLMALEANTFDLYLKLGRDVKSDRARSVFMRLSEEEADHLDKLSSVFEKTL